MQRGERINRRDFLFTTGLFGVLAAACSRPVTIGEGGEVVEQERTATFGDVVVIQDNKAYLLSSDNKRHEFRSEDEIRRYAAASKLTEYGRGVFPVAKEELDKYPLQPRLDDAFLISPYTGLPIVNQMGEVALLWAGLFSNYDFSYEITPQGTFPVIAAGLKEKEWPNSESLLFTYHNLAPRVELNEVLQKGGFGYTPWDTLQGLNDLFKYADEHCEATHEQLPFCQQDSIAHSLGGVLALHAAMAHPDWFNVLVLINSPVRGLKKDFARRVLYDAFNKIPLAKLAELGIDTKYVEGGKALLNDLFALWENKDYQRKLDDFTASFIRSGKKIVVVTDENDPIVHEEEASLKGAIPIRIKGNYAVNLLEALPAMVKFATTMFTDPSSLREVLERIQKAHGNPLYDEKVVRAIMEILGDNLSFPIGRLKVIPPRIPVQPDFSR